MASVTVVLPTILWTEFHPYMYWLPVLTSAHVALGSTLSADGNTQLFLGLLALPIVRNTNFILRLSDGSSDASGAGPEFSSQMESKGSMVLSIPSGESITLIGTGGDTTEPYEWRPTNLSDLVTFANVVRNAARTSPLTITFDDLTFIPPQIRASIKSGVPSLTARVRTTSAITFTDNTGDLQFWTIFQEIRPITVPEAVANLPLSYAPVGNLPDGINFNPTTRVISGDPRLRGVGKITIRASNAEGFADWTVSYAVADVLGYNGSFEIDRGTYESLRITSDSTGRALARKHEVVQVSLNKNRAHYSDLTESVDLSKLKNYVQVFGLPGTEVYVDSYIYEVLTEIRNQGGALVGYTFDAVRAYLSDGSLGKPSLFLADADPGQSGGVWTAALLRAAGDDASDTRAYRIEVVSPGETGSIAFPHYAIYDERENTFAYMIAGLSTGSKRLWVVAPSGTSVYASDFDADSIKEHGQRAYIIRDNGIDNEATALTRAQAELRRFTSNIEKLTLITTQDGFVVGTKVRVVSTAYEINPSEVWYIEAVVIRGLHGHLREYEMSMRRLGTKSSR